MSECTCDPTGLCWCPDDVFWARMLGKDKAEDIDKNWESLAFGADQ